MVAGMGIKLTVAAFLWDLCFSSLLFAQSKAKPREDYLYHCVEMKFIKQDSHFKKWRQCVGSFKVIGSEKSRALPKKIFTAAMVRKPVCPDEGLVMYGH